MSATWIERLLLGKEALKVARESEERIRKEGEGLEEARLDFAAMRGRLLAFTASASERCRPVSIPDTPGEQRGIGK